MLIKNANVFRTDERRFVKCDIRVSDGIITEIGYFNDNTDKLFDADGLWIVPGLVDVHTHGRQGYDFLDADETALHEIARSFAERGVTSVMPTLASAPLEDMYATVGRMNEFTPAEDEANFCGVHIEGRYLNPAKRGAHAIEMLSVLDAKELEAEVFRMCRALHISAAYELDKDGSFSQKAKEIGATLGLAHTCATYDEARVAEERGVTSYTHLFNTMPPLAHRDGGAVCAALTGDNYAELICDGIHVSPEMVRLAYKMLGGERLVLISDSMQATGCPDGEYAIAGTPVIVKDGIARTPDGALAGSTLTVDTAVNNLMRFCGISLENAIPCVTANPAKQMGVYDVCGSIDVGKRADMLFLKNTSTLQIEKIMINGRFIKE
jgi:N-acetylglucosamine-6-phosphate deacetylase